MTTNTQSAIELLEAQGFTVVPPEDLPPIRVDEKELLAVIDDMNALEFSGRLLGQKVSIAEPSFFSNHSVENEYRHTVAHLAMARWYRENLAHESKVAELANELVKGEGIERYWLAPKKVRRRAVKAARAQLRILAAVTA